MFKTISWVRCARFFEWRPPQSTSTTWKCLCWNTPNPREAKRLRPLGTPFAVVLPSPRGDVLDFQALRPQTSTTGFRLIWPWKGMIRDVLLLVLWCFVDGFCWVLTVFVGVCRCLKYFFGCCFVGLEQIEKGVLEHVEWECYSSCWDLQRPAKAWMRASNWWKAKGLRIYKGTVDQLRVLSNDFTGVAEEIVWRRCCWLGFRFNLCRSNLCRSHHPLWSCLVCVCLCSQYLTWQWLFIYLLLF